MRILKTSTGAIALIAMLAGPATGSLAAQEQDAADPNITVTGTPLPDLATLDEGPEVKGIISARRGDMMLITAGDGTRTMVALSNETRIRRGGGLFGGGEDLAADALLNGLPVTIRTMQYGDQLVASQIRFRNGDYRTASMIRNGTEQQFAAQTAATEALRGRMADIDNYNIKSTANVYFDTGKAVLSPRARQDLCSTAQQAETTDNALMLVVGYTDSVGSDEYNQQLSERRASSVINHLQQACRWKPYRMLTPTGMAESDPLASNDTAEGKAQNRRVSVNVLVSKGLDGL